MELNKNRKRDQQRNDTNTHHFKQRSGIHLKGVSNINGTN
jgi:hypothetical protein